MSLDRLTIGLVERSKHFRLCPAHFALSVFLRDPDTFNRRKRRRKQSERVDDQDCMFNATLVEEFFLSWRVIFRVGDEVTHRQAHPSRCSSANSRRVDESEALFRSSLIGGRRYRSGSQWMSMYE